MVLDQRGTGQSTRMDAQAPSLDTDERRLRTWRYFRQTRSYDGEALRRELCGDDPWTTSRPVLSAALSRPRTTLAPQGLKASSSREACPASSMWMTSIALDV